MKSKSILFLMVVFIFGLLSCKNNSSELSFLPDLRKATQDDFSGKELTSITDLKLPRYMINGTKIDSTISIYDIILKDKVVPEIYVNSSGQFKAMVFRHATGKEYEYWENITKSLSTHNNSDTTKISNEINLLGRKAIPFSLKSMDDKYYSLENLKGNIIVINFWFAECKPCVEETPLLNDIADKYANENIIFLAITFDMKETVELFLESERFDYCILPESRKVIFDYGVNTFPTHLIIDENLTIVHYKVGFDKDDIDSMGRKIDSLLKDARSTAPSS